MPTRAEQEALRAAFMAGSFWRATSDEGVSKPEAIRRYPIQEPRVVTLTSQGLRPQEYRVVDGQLQWRYQGLDSPWTSNYVYTQWQLEQLVGLFKSPMENV